MKATILEVDGPEEGNVFEIFLKVETDDLNTYDTKIQCVSIGNVEFAVKNYLEECIKMQNFKGKTVEVQ